jgi:hypothetical protein
VPGRTPRFGVGQASQGQRSAELAVEDGESDFFAPERATLIALAWEERLSAGLSLRAEIFDKRGTHVRPRWENLFEPIELFPETESDRIRIAPQAAHSYGVELGLERRAEHGRWWLRYVHSRARERVLGRWQARAWDQPHALLMGVDRSFGAGWRVSAQLDAHSGWPTTQVTAVESPDGSIEAILGPRNGERLETYINLWARLSREQRFGDGTLTWYVEAFNLLDRENGLLVEQFELERQPDGSLRVRRELEGGLPFLPSFGVIWRF